MQVLVVQTAYQRHECLGRVLMDCFLLDKASQLQQLITQVLLLKPRVCKALKVVCV